MDDEVVAAYDAPFPVSESKAGARAFPLMLPTDPQMPGAAAGKRVLEALRADSRPKLHLWADSDPDHPVQGRRAVRRRDQRGAAREDRERLALPAGGRRRADRHAGSRPGSVTRVDRTQPQAPLGRVCSHGCDLESHSHERPALPTWTLLRPTPPCGVGRVGGDLHRPDRPDRGDRQADQLERHPRRHRARPRRPTCWPTSFRRIRTGPCRSSSWRQSGTLDYGRQREGGQGDDQVPGKTRRTSIKAVSPLSEQGLRRALEGQDDRLHLGDAERGA